MRDIFTVDEAVHCDLPSALRRYRPSVSCRLCERSIAYEQMRGGSVPEADLFITAVTVRHRSGFRCDTEVPDMFVLICYVV